MPLDQHLKFISPHGRAVPSNTYYISFHLRHCSLHSKPKLKQIIVRLQVQGVDIDPIPVRLVCTLATIDDDFSDTISVR